jgi:hypothetical protein
MAAELLDWCWRSGLETVGFVLVRSGDGKQRAYVGVARGGSSSEEVDARYIADHGGRLQYHEAVAFFPAVKAEDYSNTSI